MDTQPISYRRGGTLVKKQFDKADYPMIVSVADTSEGGKTVHNENERLLFESEICESAALHHQRLPVFAYFAAIPVFK